MKTATTHNMSVWQPIETAKECKVVLTQHEDDLYPVVAFYTKDLEGRMFWMRETEGPEDTFDRRNGKYEQLYRAPTHWQPLPESPTVEAERVGQGGTA